MKEKFVNNATIFVTKYYSYEGKEFDKLFYGLQSFYSFITKTSVVFLISFLLGTLKETFLIMFFYIMLHSFTFGIHASKNLYCWLTTIPIYIITSLVAKNIMINDSSKVLIIIFGFISILLFAPSDTHKRPLINAKKRIISKALALITALCFEIVILFSNNIIIINTISIALIIQCICINPLIYKLFKMPYHNYKRYIKKV